MVAFTKLVFVITYDIAYKICLHSWNIFRIITNEMSTSLDVSLKWQLCPRLLSILHFGIDFDEWCTKITFKTQVLNESNDSCNKTIEKIPFR